MGNKFLPLGGGDEIGASCYYLEIDSSKILIDAGIRLNCDSIFPRFNALYELDILDGLWELDAIFVTHGHLDHCGSLPYVHSEARRVPIYATKETKQIATLLLNDTSRIKNSADTDASVQLYNKLLVEETIDSIIEVNFNESFFVSNLDITFYQAGHILGAAMIYIQSENKNILLSGDYSSFDQHTVKKYSIPSNLEIDLLITETTYGYQSLNINRTLREERTIFINTVLSRIQAGGTVLIPAFAIGRSQELALIFRKYFDENRSDIFPIFIGGLAAEASLLYEKNGISIFNEFITRAPYSKKRLKNSLIIASSGMMLEGTTSSQIAAEIIDSEFNMICFSGYLDEESPGRALSDIEKNKNKFTRINGKHLEVRADISTYRLSAHTNNEGILELVKCTNAKEIILIHGFPSFAHSVNIYNDIAAIRGNIKLHQSINENIIYI